MGKLLFRGIFFKFFRKINLADENGIIHDYGYEEECNALNALGDEIGHMRVYQNGYYHTFDANGKIKS